MELVCWVETDYLGTKKFFKKSNFSQLILFYSNKFQSFLVKFS